MNNDKKHNWKYEEDLLCCKRYIDIFVTNKNHSEIEPFILLLQLQLPHIKMGSLKMKVQNIKKILQDLNIDDSLHTTPLKNYSKQNKEAALSILNNLKLFS